MTSHARILGHDPRPEDGPPPGRRPTTITRTTTFGMEVLQVDANGHTILDQAPTQDAGEQQ